MKINEFTVITGENVILVPYNKEHVEKYHSWMLSEELQTLTASEPLSIEQEYEMQKSWREDEDKCTFIILDKEIFETSCNEIEAMIGDTNVFLKKDDDCNVGEIEIMIAEEGARRQHRGWESTLLMLRYCIEKLKIEKFEAKILQSNDKCISMFKKLKFKQSYVSDVFQEVTFTRNVIDEWKFWIFQNTQQFCESKRC